MKNLNIIGVIFVLSFLAGCSSITSTPSDNSSSLALTSTSSISNTGCELKEWSPKAEELMRARLGIILPYIDADFELISEKEFFVVAEGNEELLNQYYEALINEGFHHYDNSSSNMETFSLLINDTYIEVNVGLQNGLFFIEAFHNPRINWNDLALWTAMNEIFNQTLPYCAFDEYTFEIIEDKLVVQSPNISDSLITKFLAKLEFDKYALIEETESNFTYIKLDSCLKYVTINISINENGTKLEYYFQSFDRGWKTNQDTIINWLGEELPFPYLTPSYDISINEELVISDVFNWECFLLYQQTLVENGFQLFNYKTSANGTYVKIFEYQYQKVINEISYRLSLSINVNEFKIIIEKTDLIKPTKTIENWGDFENVLALYISDKLPAPALSNLYELQELAYEDALYFFVQDYFTYEIIDEYRITLLESGFEDVTDSDWLDGADGLIDYAMFSKTTEQYRIYICAFEFNSGVEFDFAITLL